MYDIIISKTFKKKFDKLPKIIRDRAKMIINKLHYEIVGEALIGDLKGLYSIHFEKNKYRIIYGKNKSKIFLVHIGKRTNSFYEKFKKK
jgi:addiction module RelE/StbE family toxin